MEERRTKQVIVIRKDLKMRRGKEISQGAHASMGALLSLFKKDSLTNKLTDGNEFKTHRWVLSSYDDEPVEKWLNGSFTKITLTVQTEQELVDLQEKAKSSGIPCALIEDNGVTEFNGVKTKTALGIGPWWNDEIDKITGNLPLY